MWWFHLADLFPALCSLASTVTDWLAGRSASQAGIPVQWTNDDNVCCFLWPPRTHTHERAYFFAESSLLFQLTCSPTLVHQEAACKNDYTCVFDLLMGSFWEQLIDGGFDGAAANDLIIIS